MKIPAQIVTQRLSGGIKMPTVKLNDLNTLKGAGNTSFAGAMNEGQQTVDKVKDIVNGINNILTKVQGFKQNAQASVEQSQQTQTPKPTPTPSINSPSDMQTTKRAIVHIEEDKIIPQIKEFIKNLPEDAKEKKLSDFISQFEGNEQVVKAVTTQLIKQNTSIKYID